MMSLPATLSPGSVVLQFGAICLVFLLLYVCVLALERQLLGRQGSLRKAFREICAPGPTLACARPVALCVGAMLALGTTLSSALFLPWGSIHFAGRQIALGIVSLPFGLPLFFLWLGLGFTGCWLVEQAAGTKPRHSSSDLGVCDGSVYIIPCLVALGGVVVLSESLDLAEIARAQGRALPFAIYQPLGLAVFTLSFLMAWPGLPMAKASGKAGSCV